MTYEKRGYGNRTILCEKRTAFNNLNERIVRCIWYDHRAFLKDTIRSTGGKRVTVLFPGEWNSGRGPDFLNGVLTLGSTQQLCRDIEVHLRRTDWKAHGHRKDPAFGSVGFHVFLWDDLPDGSYCNASGKRLIEICLAPYLKSSPKRLLKRVVPSDYPYGARHVRGRCGAYLHRRSRNYREHVLRAAGEARLAEKAARFALRARSRGREHALYSLLLEALGYSRNKQNFLRLANHLPWNKTRKILLETAPNRRAGVMEALLMGTAGLIPEAAGPNWDTGSIRRWKRIRCTWESAREAWGLKEGERSRWQLSGTRPANDPCRRLAGITPLLARSVEKGLIPTLLPEGKPIDFLTLDHSLAQLLSLPRSSYWLHHYRWGGARLSRPVTLVGRERRIKIIANVICPALVFLGECTKARAIFTTLPALSPSSTMKYMMMRTGGNGDPLFRRGGMAFQQGLLHLYQTFCAHDTTGCTKCSFPNLFKPHPKRS